MKTMKTQYRHMVENDAVSKGKADTCYGRDEPERVYTNGKSWTQNDKS